MKNTLTYTALTLAWPVLLYLAIGFVNWNWNAAEWDKGGRAFWVMIGFCLSWAAPAFYHNHKEGLV
jgi:hypothetical protein